MFVNFYTTQMSGGGRLLKTRFEKMRARKGKLSGIAALICAAALLTAIAISTAVMAAADGEGSANADFEAEFILPCEGVITSAFGYRIHPITGEEKLHGGIDMGGSLNDPVFAAENGEIVETGFDSVYGNYIKIRHGAEFETFYAHCSSVNVKAGDVVNKGDVIGRLGRTGSATGVCLHFEIFKNGERIDPLLCLNA